MTQAAAQLIAERGKTHGDFNDHARITQTLKSVIDQEYKYRAQRDQPSLAWTQVEALDMITHKIGRILAGQCNYKDHWADIAGYAQLVADRCKD